MMTWAALLWSDPKALTIEDALQIAKDNNYSLKANDVSLHTAVKKEKAAWNVFMPTMNLSMTYAKSNEVSTTSALTPVPSSFSPGDNSFDKVQVMSFDSKDSLVAQMTAQLNLNLAIGNGIKALKLNSESASLDRQVAWQDTALDVQKSFYQILLLQKQRAILQSQYQTMEQRLKDVRNMYNNGYSTELDLLQVQVGLERMKPSLTQMDEGIKNGIKGLTYKLGLPQEQEITLVGEISVDDLSGVEGDLDSSLTLLQLDNNLEQLENAKKAAFYQNLPTLTLGWGYNPILGNPTDGDKYSSFSDYFDSDNWSDQGSLTITLSMPLDAWLPFSSSQMDIDGYKDQIKALGYQKLSATEGLAVQLKSLRSTLVSQSQTITASLKGRDLAKRTYDLTKVAYRSGTKTYYELKSAEDDYLSAEFDYISSQYDYLMTYLDLKYNLGQF